MKYFDRALMNIELGYRFKLYLIISLCLAVHIRDADECLMNEYSFNFLLFKLIFYSVNVRFCRLAFIV